MWCQLWQYVQSGKSLFVNCGFAIWDGWNIHHHQGLAGDHGMNCLVLTVYCNDIAAFALAPFVLITLKSATHFVIHLKLLMHMLFTNKCSFQHIIHMSCLLTILLQL